MESVEWRVENGPHVQCVLQTQRSNGIPSPESRVPRRGRRAAKGDRTALSRALCTCLGGAGDGFMTYFIMPIADFARTFLPVGTAGSVSPHRPDHVQTSRASRARRGRGTRAQDRDRSDGQCGSLNPES